MVQRPLITANRSRRKPTPERPKTGTVPTIVSVQAVAGQVNQIEITFTNPVIVTELPPWPALVGGAPVEPVGIVAQTATSLTLDYGQDVSTATAVQIPVNDQSALSYTAQRVPVGSYPLAA